MLREFGMGRQEANIVREWVVRFMVPYKSQHRHVQSFVEGKIYKLNKQQQKKKKNELECTDFEIQIHFHVQHV